MKYIYEPNFNMKIDSHHGPKSVAYFWINKSPPFTTAYQIWP